MCSSGLKPWLFAEIVNFHPTMLSQAVLCFSIFCDGSSPAKKSYFYIWASLKHSAFILLRYYSLTVAPFSRAIAVIKWATFPTVFKKARKTNHLTFFIFVLVVVI